MKFRVALFFILLSGLAFTDEWDQCSNFRREYDAMSQLKENTIEERDKLHLGFRKILNEEIQQTAEGESVGEVGEDNNKATRVYYRLRKVRAKLARLEEGLKRLTDEKCAICASEPVTEKKAKPDCLRCPTQKSCSKEKT